MAKRMFIGLGGTGVKTLGPLKARLLDYYQRDVKRMEEECRFLFVDTNDGDIARVKAEHQGMMPPGRVFIDRSEMVDLGDVNPFAIWDQINTTPPARRDAAQKSFMDWIDDRGVRALKNQELRKGASANRQQGRIALWARRDAFERKIRAAFLALRPVEGVQEPITIYVVSSSCGGTGSSMFLDLLYLVNVLHVRMFARTRPPVLRTMIFMPHFFATLEESRADRYRANAYAFFDEIQASLDDRYVGTGAGRNYAAASPWGTIGVSVPFEVFNSTFLVDDLTSKGGVLKEDELYPVVADFMYYWQLGAEGGKILEHTDNVKGPYLIASFGYRALRYPDHLLKEYFRRRLLYELAHHGLIGKPAEAAEDGEHSAAKCQEVFRNHFKRYLFASDRFGAAPNLEADRSVILEAKLGELSGLRAGFGHPKKAGKLDGAKIKDPSLLRELDDNVQAVIGSMKDEMKDRFNAEGGSSRSKLVAAALKGCAPDPEGFEDVVEELILRYGLAYAMDFVTRIDNLCWELYQKSGDNNDLGDQIRRLEAECAAVRGEIAEKMQSALNDKDFNELVAKYEVLVRTEGQRMILEQICTVLKDLTYSSEGRLDKIGQRLAALQKAANERVFVKKDGYKDRIDLELLRDVENVDKEVTTTYIPNVKDFVQGGQWASDSYFDRRYQEFFLPHVAVPGRGSEPLRAGDPDVVVRDGVHKVLYGVLAGVSDSYRKGETTNFFRRVFAGPSPDAEPEWNENTLLQEFEAAVRGHVSTVCSREEALRKEIDKNLVDRFEALENAEKLRLRDAFSSADTVFCDLNGTPETKIVFAGETEKFAVELGYNRDDSSHDFVVDRTQNRMVVLNVKVDYRFKDYVFYDALKESYFRLKNDTGDLHFSPHIHAAFNVHGAGRGLSVVAERSRAHEEEPSRDLFVRMLFYREMLEHANTEQRMFFSRLVSEDPKGSCLPAPVTLSERKAVIARECKEVKGKLVLPLATAESINGVKNWAVVFEQILGTVDHSGFFRAFKAYDDYVRAGMSFEWNELIRMAEGKLHAKFADSLKIAKAAASATNEVLFADWLERLPNIVMEFNRAMSQGRQPAAGGTEKIGAEDIEMPL